MNIKTKVVLIAISTLLLQCLELLNRLDASDHANVIDQVRRQHRHLKNILENVDRGDPFMLLFFIRELIDSLPE